MRKKLLMSVMLAGVLALAACGGDKPTAQPSNLPVVDIDITNPDATAAPTGAPTKAPTAAPIWFEEEETEEKKDGFYRSELTNEWLDESLRNQRPMAIMVDNEITALDHFGLNDHADIVYEVINSLANDRVTRLMVLVKDWKNLEQFGSIRSVRTTNFLLAAEYNAVLIHDGGPYFINPFVEKGIVPHISGGFARYSNGKPSEFTEYVTSKAYTNPKKGETYDGLITRMQNAKISESYTDDTVYDHFNFAKVDLSALSQAMKADNVLLSAFRHNKSSLAYNADTKLYEYSTYGKPHVDPLDDNNVLTFKNLIIQNGEVTELDEHGYMHYELLDNHGEGYFITNGYAVPITWSKDAHDESHTVYKIKETGEVITLNTGRTYIAIIPADDWTNITIE